MYSKRGRSLWSHAERRDRSRRSSRPSGGPPRRPSSKAKVKGAPGFPPGNEPTLSRYYTSHWDDSFFGGYYVWSHRFQNMIILVAFILFFRFATFYALERINYATR